MIEYKKLFIGSVCNNQCIMCPNTGERVGRSLEDILSGMDAPRGPIDSLEIVGGEPAIRSDLGAIVDEAGRRGWRRIKMLTNACAFANPSMAAGVVESGVRVFEIKLLGHVPQLHDALARTPGSFVETIQGLANLRGVLASGGEAPFVALRVPIVEANQPYLPSIVSLAVQLGVDRVTLAFVDPTAPMSSVVGSVKAAIDTGLVNSIWIQTEGLPLCMMGGYEHHVHETFAGTRVDAACERREGCEACAYTACPGIPSSYLEERGADEFVAVIDSAYAAQIVKDPPDTGKP